jgi:tetratricopeptide (TPR) repeat protein
MPATAELLSAYIRQRPAHAFGWYILGDAQRILGVTFEAERALCKGLELAPKKNRWIIEVSLATLYADSGSHERADAQFASALKDPDCASRGWVWILRGANLAKDNQLKAAEKCQRRATEMSGDDRNEAYLNLGMVLRAQGRYSDAAAAFRQALAITPKYGEAVRELASLQGLDKASRLLRRLPNLRKKS